MAANVGTLWVTLRGDLNQLKTDFNKLNQSVDQGMGRMKRWSGELSKNLIRIGAAFVSLRFAKGVVDLAGQLGDLAERTGISAATLSGLRQTIVEGGLSLETFARGIQRAQQRLGDIEGTGKRAGEAFKRMGLNVNDLISASPEEFLQKFARGLASVKNQNERVAIATQVMGEAGAELVPTLIRMADGFERLRRSGMSEADIKALDDFGDALTRLSNTLQILSAAPLAEFSKVLAFTFGGKSITELDTMEEKLGRVQSRLASLRKTRETFFPGAFMGADLTKQIQDLEREEEILKNMIAIDKAAAERKRKEEQGSGTKPPADKGQIEKEIKGLNDLQKAFFSHLEDMQKSSEFGEKVKEIAQGRAAELKEDMISIEKELSRSLMSESQLRVATALDEFEDRKKRIEAWRDAAVAAGEDVDTVNRRAAENLRKTWQVALNDMKTATEDTSEFMRRAMERTFDAIGDSLTDLMDNGITSFEELAETIRRTINRLVADQLTLQLTKTFEPFFTNPLGAFGFPLGGGAGGGAVPIGSSAGGTFSGTIGSILGFREGGEIGPFGRIALPDFESDARLIKAHVGETIIPAGEKMGGDTYVHNWHFHNSDADSFKRSRSQTEGVAMRIAMRGRRKN